MNFDVLFIDYLNLRIVYIPIFNLIFVNVKNFVYSLIDSFDRVTKKYSMIKYSVNSDVPEHCYTNVSFDQILSIINSLDYFKITVFIKFDDINTESVLNCLATNGIIKV